MAERPKKILIADDSKTYLAYVSRLLRKMGYSKITLAENGREALKLIAIWMPDVVLLDVDMPDMDGFATLKNIREDKDTSEIPVIIVTDDESAEAADKCSGLGGSGLLGRPPEIALLHKKLQECIISPGSGRRINLRTEFNKKVGITNAGRTEVLMAKSLSEEGVFVVKDDLVPVGTKLEIILPVWGESHINLAGNVIYHRGTGKKNPSIPIGMAIKFSGLNDEVSEFLSNYVTEIITGRRPKKASGIKHNKKPRPNAQ
jgi:CheY-like chemotaxis protein